MELHALDGQRAVANAHDLAVFGPRGDLQLGRTARALDRKRMVARRLVWAGQPCENAMALVVDARNLAVHERLRMHDAAAERLADRLVAEAHAQDRHGALQLREELEANAGLVRRARPGRQDDALGPELRDRVHREL